MTPYYTDESVTLHHGDCLDVLRTLPDSSVDSVVCDPPYGLEFMGKDWDAPWKSNGLWNEKPHGEDNQRPTDDRGQSTGLSRWTNPRPTYAAGLPFQQWCELWATECLRVLKPGGHLLAFGGSRTWHRLACAVEDAGFEVRDSIAWLYGSGFPKSLDVSKAIDKRPGVMRHAEFGAMLREAMTAKGYTNTFDVAEKVIGRRTGAVANWIKYQFPEAKWWPALRDLLDLDEDTWGPVIAEAERAKVGTRAGNRLAVAPGQGMDRSAIELDVTTHATPDAERWQGWGTALKPSHEPVVVARKPHVIGGILDGIGSELTRLEGECRRSANGAAKSSAPTPAASPAARTATAPASAATPHEAGQEPTTATGVAAGSSGQTDTSWSDETAPTPWSTVSSWRACWAELCELTSTSTTSTTTEATTDLRTLWSSISSLTVTSTPGSPTPALTSGSTASAVDSLFAATVLRLRATLALSADESATASTPRVPQGAGGASAFEPIVVARKPLSGTVAQTVLAHGTGALNIDGCRVEGGTRPLIIKTGEKSPGSSFDTAHSRQDPNGTTAGRWPTNVVLDDSQAAELDQQSGETTSGSGPFMRRATLNQQSDVNIAGRREEVAGVGHDDSGGASRFFPTFRYEAKAPTSERPRVNGVAHPTVKPLDLMRWLVRLVTPPGGTVLEPFAGSGTTVEACIAEGFHCIAIEREADYLPLVMQRVNRRRDPVAYIKAAGDDLGLFDLGDIS